MVRFGWGGVNDADAEVINGAPRKTVCICDFVRRVGGEPNQCIGSDNSPHLERFHVVLSNMYAMHCGTNRPRRHKHFDSVIDEEQGPVTNSICRTHYQIVIVGITRHFVPNLYQPHAATDRCSHGLHDAEFATQFGVRDKVHTSDESRATRHVILALNWILAESTAANSSIKATANVPGPCAFIAANSAAIV